MAGHVLGETQSICPVCHRPVRAFYMAEAEEIPSECCDGEPPGCSYEASCCTAAETETEKCCCGDTGTSDCCVDAACSGRVYFVKECPDHGIFRTTAAEDAQDYMRWVRNPVINIPPEKAMTSGDPDDMECPLHCGTCENHLQTACCVLIDLTDRCNQHCPYCFAKAEEDADRSSEPSLAELEAKFDLLIELGEERPFNIQLSGGEPTVRDDLPEIISMARRQGVRIHTDKYQRKETGY